MRRVCLCLIEKTGWKDGEGRRDDWVREEGEIAFLSSLSAMRLPKALSSLSLIDAAAIISK